MIRSAVTVSLVPEARGGPFVFWNDLPAGCRKAAELGFDAIEVFPPSPEALRESNLKQLLADHGLKLAAVGTGAGWVKHRLTLTDADPAHCGRAIDFVRGIIDAAAELGAPAIVGSMQGRWDAHMDREAALFHLNSALADLGTHAGDRGTFLLYEPLNRYETNLINTLGAAQELLSATTMAPVRLLADLFHMNIEENDLSSALIQAGAAVGHVHFADSNRGPAGQAHTDFEAVARALRHMKYEGYVSAECLPLPDPDAAARLTMESFRKYFQPTN